MPETPVSLLERLRLRPDNAAWKQLVDLYDPLLRSWLRSQGMQASDVDDVVQEVFRILVAKMPEFRHNGQKGAFRTWLRQVMGNCLTAQWRSRRSRPGAAGDGQAWRALEQFHDPNSELSRFWDEEHNLHLAQGFLKQVDDKFEAVTCRAFRGVVVEGKKPTVVATELGLTANAVRVAKFRVLRWLREASAGLID